jgi:hypothetical protein
MKVQRGHYLHLIGIFNSKPDRSVPEVVLLAIKNGYCVSLVSEGHRDITVDREVAHPRREASHTMGIKMEISRDLFALFVLHPKT